MLPTASALFEKLPRPLRRHRLMTAWMSLTGENPLQLVRIRGNCFGYADMSDGFLRLIVIDGDFESDFFRIADAFLAGGGVFLDVGANHGLLSCGLAGCHAGNVHFHLFEPNPKLVASIRQSVAHYPSMQYSINPVAVSDRVGTTSFQIDEGQTGASHISDRDGIAVPTTTFDHYLDQAHIPRVELLKIDIEGYELLALRGARRSLEVRRIQAIYFEYFEKCLVRVSPPRELLEYLDALGYEVCFCRQGDLVPRGGATHTVRKELPGHGVPLLPVKGHEIPAMTDLIAVPKENIVAIAA
jgi:FkbM family methyltransferase